MNQEQFAGQLRTFLAAIVAVIATKYLPPEITKAMPPDAAVVVATLLAALPSAAWSFWAKRPDAVAARVSTVITKAGQPELAARAAAVIAPATPPKA